MSADIVRAAEWEDGDEQIFVGTGLGREDITLHRSNRSKTWLEASLETVSPIEEFDYSPSNTGIFGYTTDSGAAHVANMLRNKHLISLEPQQSRKGFGITFSTSGLIAEGLDRHRLEDSLLIWDATQSREPLLRMFPNEKIWSLRFLPSRPTAILCGSPRMLRVIDIRMSTSAITASTKYTQMISLNKKDDNLFCSSADSGALAMWDRRMFSDTRAAEPLILIPRVFASGRSTQRCMRFSPRYSDEFGVLHDRGIVRQWLTSRTPGNGSQLATALSSHTSEPGSLFVSRVEDIDTGSDKVVGFDYAPAGIRNLLDLVCVRQSGQVFRIPAREPPQGVYFDPENNFMVCDSHRIMCLQRSLETKHPSERSLTEDESSDESLAESSSEEEIVVVPDLLCNDISTVMRLRAIRGYSVDARRNIEIFKKEHAPGGLLAAWHWIEREPGELAAHLKTERADLRYCGISGMWTGLSPETLKGRCDDPSVVDDAFKQASRGLKGEVYLAQDDDATTTAYRRIGLRMTGWDFGLKQLESRIVNLESKGDHEKAAAWAVFHGDVSRAVQSLAASRKTNLRLMSSAVAGYLVYKDVSTTNPWREQCRRLASEMSNPYLRAIFAYIADGSWFDLLDDGSLPLTERLGVALRFLKRKELSQYLSRLTEKVIAAGDLEGILLTGLTPRFVELLQSYLDRTGDIQTVSLLASFGWPRFIADSRVGSWLEEYRSLLDSWQLFKQRAMFDVGRNKLVGAAPVPRQIFLRCFHCREPIGGKKRVGSKPANRSRCPSCGAPLPSCAVCLLPIGPSLEDRSHADRWPTFCLSCNHVYHSVHAREWFARYDICPVPSCSCLCGKT